MAERMGGGKDLEGFIHDIEKRSSVLTELVERLWLAVVDQVRGDREAGMTFRFKNGTEITV